MTSNYAKAPSAAFIAKISFTIPTLLEIISHEVPSWQFHLKHPALADKHGK